MKRTFMAVAAAGLICLSASVSAANAAAPVTAAVSQTSAYPGDSITVSGQSDASDPVSLRVLDGNNSMVVFDAGKTDGAGQYSFTFMIPATAAAGTLRVLTGSGEQVAEQAINLIRGQTPVKDRDKGSGGSSGGSSPAPASQGKVQAGSIELQPELAADASGRKNAVGDVDDSLVNEALKDGAAGLTIKLSTEGADIAGVRLSAEALARIAESQAAFIEVISELGSYRLPVHVINRSELADRLGVGEGQVTLQIRLIRATAGQTESFRSAVNTQGGAAVAPVIDFVVEASAGGNAVPMDSFGSTYVSRTLFLNRTDIHPDGITAVRLTESGGLKFVPAVFTLVNGRWQAAIKRNGNSLYTVIEHKRSFQDMADHWARTPVEKMASKLVIDGMTEQSFAPDTLVTRAQFTALIVRALGLEDEAAAAGFKDVSAGDWYEGAVAAASRAQLVSGYEDGSFQPEKPITRQELAVLIQRALSYVSGAEGIASSSSQALDIFQDQADIAVWAKPAVAGLVSAGLTDGKSKGRFEPASHATRAEAAVLLQRLLQKVEFIN